MGRGTFIFLMVLCLSWNLFNLFHYTGGVFQNAGYLGTVPYVMLCCFGTGWCVYHIVKRLAKSEK